MSSFQIQVIVTADNGQQETREIAVLTRGDLTLETLGLSLAEGKAILRDLQQIVVEQQAGSLMASQKRCSTCGQLRHSKGCCDLSIRTLFGKVTVQSQRLYHCCCQAQQTKTFSQLAQVLPQHITPEIAISADQMVRSDELRPDG